MSSDLTVLCLVKVEDALEEGNKLREQLSECAQALTDEQRQVERLRGVIHDWEETFAKAQEELQALRGEKVCASSLGCYASEICVVWLFGLYLFWFCARRHSQSKQKWGYGQASPSFLCPDGVVTYQVSVSACCL